MIVALIAYLMIGAVLGVFLYAADRKLSLLYFWGFSGFLRAIAMMAFLWPLVIIMVTFRVLIFAIYRAVCKYITDEEPDRFS